MYRQRSSLDRSRERRSPRRFRKRTTTPMSALIRSTSIRATISGSRCAAHYIHEFQNLNASFANGLAANPTNTLNEARAYASLAYGNNNRVVLTGQYFTSWGSPDAVLFATWRLSPNTNGWIAEIAYIPFISSQAPGWPWFNVRARAAIHLVQRIQRNDRRRQRQQYAVPLCVGGDVAGFHASWGVLDESNTARSRCVFAVDCFCIWRRSRVPPLFRLRFSDGRAATAAAKSAAAGAKRTSR